MINPKDNSDSFGQLQQELINCHLLIKVLTLALLFFLIYSLSFRGFDLPKLLFPYFSLIMLSVIGVAAIFLITSSSLPLMDFGITNARAKKSIIEGFLYGFYVMVFVLFLKWIALHYNPAYADQSLFNFYINHRGTIYSASSSTYLVLFFTYFLSAPLQELIIRGTLQNVLRKTFLNYTRKVRVWLAIIISNLTFAMIHLHISVLFIIGSFFFGLLLGYMYERHKNLWGVSITHTLVGSWVMFFVGFSFH